MRKMLTLLFPSQHDHFKAFMLSKQLTQGPWFFTIPLYNFKQSIFHFYWVDFFLNINYKYTHIHSSLISTRVVLKTPDKKFSFEFSAFHRF